jgi:hypothetical protein
MRAVRPSPFDALQTTFRLLTSGPGPLALDGRCLGHGLPARPISLRELGARLVHPSATAALQRVVLEELIHRATQERGEWIIGLAGVLLPGFREVAALTYPVTDGTACDVEADLLERFRIALACPRSAAVQLVMSILEAARTAGGRAIPSVTPASRRLQRTSWEDGTPHRASWTAI